jgi:predicted RNA-binding Zn ribbon-like protein
VFYDHSRNGRRTWCAMYAGTPDGRACGTIAKVRTYRRRQGEAEASRPARDRGGVTDV